MVAQKNPAAENSLISERGKTRLKSAILNLILILGAVVMLTPLLWMLATALSPNTKQYQNPQQKSSIRRSQFSHLYSTVQPYLRSFGLVFSKACTKQFTG